MRIAIVAATLTALGFTSGAYGYALNAHVAICQHVIERVKTKGGMIFNTIGLPDLTPRTATSETNKANPTAGVLSGRARQGKFTPFNLSPESVRIVTQNPSYFRAGCGAPDAFPFFGDTDPSHSYGWDPITQSDVLWKHAKTDQEKAWVIGWKAHLAMDSAVHGFANTYAAMSMARHVPAARRINHPAVWDTFTPSNFMGHIAAEAWINNYFIYAAREENTKIDTPIAFAQRMFLDAGSPIRRHYSHLLSTWKPGSTGDVKTEIGGKKPGVLATIFHRSLEHLNQFERIHFRDYYMWEGHVRFYAGKAGFDNELHHFVARVLSSFHRRRVEKIKNIYAAWTKSTSDLQAAVSRRGSFEEFHKAIQPLKDAVTAYASPDLITSDLLPPALQVMLSTVKAFFSAISQAINKVVKEVVKTVLEPAIAKIKELAEVATGYLLDRFLDKNARRHARTLLLRVGLAKSATHGEPDARGAFTKETTGGIDGGKDFATNDANRTRLMLYPFYRNAFMGVLSVLSDLSSLKNLPSADFTNAFRCSDHFVKTRPTLQQFTGILKGNDSWYNATVETCHTPNHTRMRTAEFLNYDYVKLYSPLLTASKGFDFRTVAMQALRNLGGVLAQAGDWAWNGLMKPVVMSLLNKATTAITALWTDAKNKVTTAVTGAVTTVRDTVTAGVKKVTDFAGFNLCNGGCTLNWIPFLSCWQGRSACEAARTQCFAGCDAKFRK